MYWPILDILFGFIGLASSKEGQKVERERLASILSNLRAGLLEISSGSSMSSVDKSQFLNAASDLFCHTSLVVPNINSRFDGLAAQVESVVRSLKYGNWNSKDANDLLRALDAELASLQLPAFPAAKRDAA